MDNLSYRVTSALNVVAPLTLSCSYMPSYLLPFLYLVTHFHVHFCLWSALVSGKEDEDSGNVVIRLNEVNLASEYSGKVADVEQFFCLWPLVISINISI